MTAPARPPRNPRLPVPNPLPVWKRTEGEEEIWWLARALEMGLNLDEFDAQCGVAPRYSTEPEGDTE